MLPPWMIPADLAPGDAKYATRDWTGYTLHRIRSDADPLFPLAFDALWAEFGAKHEMEPAHLVARRLRRAPAHLTNGCHLLSELLLVTRDGALVGVRDHTAIVRPGFDLAVVHLSHNLVAPAFRRTGIAGWLRALPAQAARTLAPQLPIALVAEMEPADPADEARTIRLTAYERAAYRKIDPHAIAYLQPDFRPPAEIDATGGPRPHRPHPPHRCSGGLRPPTHLPSPISYLPSSPPPVTLFHHPGFEAPLGDHIMPIRKFRLVADVLRADPRFTILAPEPVTETDLLRVHTPAYVQAIRTGEPRPLAESQKFPWSPALHPSVCLTSGGVHHAAAHALEHGVSAALASGFHHAGADHGEGFCTFNGLIVALEKLRAAGRIRRAAILDLDLHYGNGTATLAESRDWLFALSIYGNDYWQNVPYPDVETLRHPTGANHASAILPNGCRGEEMLAILDENLPRLLETGRPDVLLYQAGADPLRDDPYSPLDLGPEDLRARDHRVFAWAKENDIPIAWVLAGGYTKDVEKVVQVHVNTAQAAAEVFR